MLAEFIASTFVQKIIRFVTPSHANIFFSFVAAFFATVLNTASFEGLEIREIAIL